MTACCRNQTEVVVVDIPPITMFLKTAVSMANIQTRLSTITLFYHFSCRYAFHGKNACLPSLFCTLQAAQSGVRATDPLKDSEKPFASYEGEWALCKLCKEQVFRIQSRSKDCMWFPKATGVLLMMFGFSAFCSSETSLGQFHSRHFINRIPFPIFQQWGPSIATGSMQITMKFFHYSWAMACCQALPGAFGKA